jgi:hypothetical protein
LQRALLASEHNTRHRVPQLTFRTAVLHHLLHEYQFDRATRQLPCMRHARTHIHTPLSRVQIRGSFKESSHCCDYDGARCTAGVATCIANLTRREKRKVSYAIRPLHPQTCSVHCGDTKPCPCRETNSNPNRLCYHCLHEDKKGEPQ